MPTVITAQIRRETLEFSNPVECESMNAVTGKKLFVP